jgi:hypothetical protein
MRRIALAMFISAALMSASGVTVAKGDPTGRVQP